jgi:hypothetical protein
LIVKQSINDDLTVGRAEEVIHDLEEKKAALYPEQSYSERTGVSATA